MAAAVCVRGLAARLSSSVPAVLPRLLSSSASSSSTLLRPARFGAAALAPISLLLPLPLPPASHSSVSPILRRTAPVAHFTSSAPRLAQDQHEELIPADVSTSRLAAVTQAVHSATHEKPPTSKAPPSQLKSFVRTVLVGTVVVVLFYVTVKIAYDLVNWLLHMSFVDSGKLGFYAGGLLTTAAFYGLGAFWRRHSSITPSALVKVLNSQLQKNPRVIEKLGADLRPAKFTAYAYSGGLRYGKDVEGWFPVAYSTPVLELMYQLNGNKSSAMVSTKVSKKNGQLVYHSLALDTNLGETLLIYGTQADVVYKGIVRLR